MKNQISQGASVPGVQSPANASATGCDEAVRAFVDEIAPEHRRTSCSDEHSNGNEFFNEFGAPRCVRCALLFRLRWGRWPYGASFVVTDIRTPDGVELRSTGRDPFPAAPNDGRA